MNIHTKVISKEEYIKGYIQILDGLVLKRKYTPVFETEDTVTVIIEDYLERPHENTIYRTSSR